MNKQFGKPVSRRVAVFDSSPAPRSQNKGISTRSLRIAALVFIVIPLLLVVVAVSSVSGPLGSLTVQASALLVPALMLSVASVLMIIADLRSAQGGTASSVFPSLVGGGGVVFVVILLRNADASFFATLRSPSFLMAILSFASMLFGACLVRISTKSRISGDRRSTTTSRVQDGGGLNGQLEKLTERLEKSTRRAQHYENADAELRARTLSAEEQLSEEKSKATRLAREVDELEGRSARLRELEEWIWPVYRSGVAQNGIFWNAIEQTCNSPKLRPLGQAILARLHLLAIADEEPELVAGMLGDVGRDFYKWIASFDDSEDVGVLEDEFLEAARSSTDHLGLEIRPVRPGDTVDPSIHDPSGSGLKVVRVHSFYVRRKSDRDVLRRARVDVK